MPVRGGSILRPTPLRPAGTTDSQGRLLPSAVRGPPRRGGWFRIRFRSRSRCLRLLRVCSRLFRCRCRLFPRQTPIYSRLLPPPLWDTCPPPLLRHLAELQNWSCRNELRDRIMSPESQCPGPHDPCLLENLRQGGGKPTFRPSHGVAVVLSNAVLPCPGRYPGQIPSSW